MNINSFAFLLICLLFSFQLLAQDAEILEPTTQISKAQWLGKIVKFGEKTPIVTTGSEKRNAFKNNKPKEVVNFANHIPRAYFNESAKPKNGDPLVEIPSSNNRFIEQVDTILNFDGIDINEAGGIWPPDTNGDVGLNHYFQCTNGGGGSTIKIFDKEGVLIYGPTSSSVFWEDISFVGLGDPIVLYDQFTQTWMFSEFSSQGNNMLIAWSETADPLGDWNVYIINAPSFPDYPKFGIWPEHLIITTNEPASPAVPTYVVNKMAMVNGVSDVDFVRFTSMTKFGGDGTQLAGAIDVDGNILPATGTNPMTIRMYDDSWEGGQDQLEMWEIDVDWTNVGAATMTNIATLNTTPFESDVCDGSIFSCIAQPSGTMVGAVQQVMMHRTQYRNFGSFESIICNHTVDVTGQNVAGVRWYELRKFPGSDWEIYQEGTLGDGVDSRFMASCAMDAAGNIGIGYNITGPNKPLSLGFSGRNSNDILGTLSVDENEFATGVSENIFLRWGDYSAMSVDPIDGQTFWYTGAYMGPGGDWKTKIVTFQINKEAVDVGPLIVESPQSSTVLSGSESVVVAFKNFGLTQQGNFDIGYSINGSAPIVENISAILEPDSTYTHAFATTVDLSAFGDYFLKIWTSLPGDGNIFNDTLTREITHLTSLDAGIYAVNGLDEFICGMNAEVAFILTNYGQEELTSCVIEYSLNGGTVVSFPWQGSLLPGERIPLTFLLTNLITDENILTISTSLPNGLADDNISNNGLTKTFDVLFDGAEVILNLLTDNYGSDVSWQLIDDNGTILLSGSGYDNTTLYVEEWCLPEGCYDFTIFDAFGDGICCGAGFGNYEIVNENGVVLAEGGEFGAQETTSFCFPFDCMISAMADASNETSIGANDGSIMVTTANAIPPIIYTLDGGPVQQTPVFNNVNGGLHTVTIVDGNNCEFNIEVEVATCAMQVTYDVVSPETASSQDGRVTVNVINANEPVEYSLTGASNYQDSPIFENVGVGNFSLAVRDALGCIFMESLEISESTNTDHLNFGHTVEIFPNPTEGVIQIEIKGLDAYYLSFEVYDMLGKQIHRGNLNAYNSVITGRISIIAFPKGTYLLKFVHPELKQLYKVVKME